MYEEFKSLANEDTQITSGKSMDILLEFYDAVLTTLDSPRPEFTKDFIDLVQKEGSKSGYNALNKVLNNPNTKVPVRAALDALISPELRKAL